jgi:hypothetical protein
LNDLTTINPGTSIRLPTDAIAAMQLARELSSARTLPQAFQKSPADVFMVMAICGRYGFDFLPTIWECSIIKNRLFFSGKMVAAMLNASGALAERLNYEYQGEGDDLEVIVTARLTGETTPRAVKVKLKSVRTENENWKRNPEQQIGYAAARIWGRRHTPEVLLGMMFEGEIIDITPDRVPDIRHTIVMPEPEPEQTAAREPIASPPTPKHVEPSRLAGPADGEWRPWATAFITAVRGSQTLDEVDAWVALNEDALIVMRENEPKMYRMLSNALEQQRDERKEAAGAESDDDAG